ncbi:hypothetical protein ACKKBG_A36975 [Auxenochlorella protothecoides x Auxenochlorella symbiontica]|uniref:ORM1-like protein 1 n=2 Tax=Auxenochlorella protothecoides TaxID=3075 RepID=A0A087SIH1_AUXPR|nr:Uncharacterized protein F751_0552 [Auxenochlorella protothecoides]KFM25525.1 Uncharacterized protein F751_0552 [Auxenochlorella protothecoides]RMZ54627.1 hypothetical protein APUTEX25_003005 [Auxenochlorella protothecoides]|eukprot:RMZ54627.1 hypothetical protein APUTEX25_003005 [Auxenochlorella protothecoides]
MESPRSQAGLGIKASEANKNTNWLDSPAAWVYYVALLLLSWLLVSSFTDPGIAWTYVHIAHGVLTYIIFHWVKGSPIANDQGVYDSQTFWEQIDDGQQFTPARKFLTAVPVVLFLLASNGTDYRRQPLGVNLIVVIVLVIAKLASMHRVRILGINKY